ncbi:hypothetical protein [Vibrio chagasii]|uniref:hypothetical protein n=1 Tax=Vibrio chagasii TaxID=170679 RepID=UPI003734FACE
MIHMYHVKNIQILTLIGLLFAIIFTPVSYASLKVNKLFQTANDYGNGSFTLTNSSKVKSYVKADIVKLETVNGELKKTPLTRDNFPLWDLAISPAKTVLYPGEIKDFSVKYLCQKDCDRSKDLVYQVRFVPVEPPKDESGQSVNLLFGVGPAYVIPARDSKIDYDLDYDKEKKTITLFNTGTSFLKMEVDGCPVTATNEAPSLKKMACRGVFYILSGRKKEFMLPENMLKFGSAKVTVVNHDQSYEKSHNISSL